MDEGNRKPGKRFSGKTAIWALVAVAGLGLLLSSGWNTVGRLVNTGNSTLTDMASGEADNSGTAVNPFTFGYDGGSPSVSPGTASGGSSKAPQGNSPQATSPSVNVPQDNAGSFWDQAPVQEYDPYVTRPGNEQYTHVEESGFKSVAVEPLSTFAADVDTASYANVRRALLEGRRVNPESVRVEEMVNYFKYDYPDPVPGEPFSVTAEVSDCPWNGSTKLLRIGMHAAEPVGVQDRLPSNFVFLIDVSGSMYDYLEQVKRAFVMLTENLDDRDRISIVTYASSDEVVMEGATGEDGPFIREAIGNLMAGGNTNGAAGIQTAYALAERYFVPGGNNRVILATDGDLNVGISTPEGLAALATEKAASGVKLSVLGFGSGNIRDDNMEALADNGDGNYYFIDSDLEARRVLVEEMGGTLNVVAKDVKFQVEFNPAYVQGYRLIGYENRTMAAQDFANDSVDGGEIGEGHRVTALYEIVPAGSGDGSLPDLRYGSAGSNSGELLTVSVRYKQPNGSESRLLTYPVGFGAVTSNPTNDFRFAACVAEAGMLLRGSDYVGDLTYGDVSRQLSSVDLDDVYKTEFRDLVKRMEMLG